ncbi:MAG: putative bifunctional diguanylate cyclase/phosphodiesterase [Janthinobacterium lividum]
MLTSCAEGPDTARVRLEDVLGRMTLPVWLFDIDRGRIVWANAAGCRMWKADTLAELQSRDFAAGMSLTVAAQLKQYQRGFAHSDRMISDVWTYYPKDVPSTIHVRYSGIRLVDGRIAMLCEGAGEVDETPENLRSMEALMHTPVMISLYGDDGSVLYGNPAAGAMRPGENERINDHFVEPADRERLIGQLRANGRAQVVAEVHTTVGRSWHEITARLCKDPVTGRQATLSSEVDVSGIKRMEAQARHVAFHDALTGLPNRSCVASLFQGHLSAFLADAGKAALLFLDLDRFKVINDSLGHGCGDEVLVEVARRLSAAVGADGHVARLGGDEFLVLVRASVAETLEQTIRDLLGVVALPVMVAERRLQLSLSIGVSLAPADGTDIVTLMKNADAAMYLAKHSGGNRPSYYISTLGQDALARMQMEIDLRSALEDERLELHYQPRVAIGSGRIVSAEVLLRWPRAGGMVSPDVFIPLAEESGLIVTLGAWVLGEAARQQVAWKRAGHSLKLSVNVSARQIAERDFLDVVRATIEGTGCDPHDLELEITERLLLVEQPEVVRTLTELRRLGFGISVDDFGVGYSNLAQLHRHPIDCLKIDKSFISNLDHQGPLTAMIINMGKLMKLRVVAEGVETERQLAWLRQRRCDEFQGYLFSRPIPRATFEDVLARERDGGPPPSLKPGRARAKRPAVDRIAAKAL